MMKTDKCNPNPAEAVALKVNGEGTKPKQADEDTEKSSMSQKVFQSNKMSNVLSLICFVLSLPILAPVIWLYTKSNHCEGLFKLASLQIGISVGLIFIFFISNIATLFSRNRFPKVAIIVVVVLLTGMLRLGVELVRDSNMDSRRVPATQMWFKMKVRDNDLWNNVKTCIYHSGVCDDLHITAMDIKSYDFSKKKLSSVQSGCCKPPEICQLKNVNATSWVKDERLANETLQSQSTDCDLWANDKETLCYDCHSCKEGYIRSLKRKWSKLGRFLVCMAVTLIFSHLLLFYARMWELHAS